MKHMEIKSNVSLKDYTTMRLGGDARFMATVSSIDDVKSIYADAKRQGLPIFILGGGSNVIAKDEGYDGIVVLNRIKGFEVISEDEATATIKIGAGEIWDEVVEKTVKMELSGIEAMSAIPGTAGAAPVQNVGAYGQEISDTLISLEAYDSVTDEVVTLSSEDCGFSYRHSIFRGEQAGRYCILNITLRLFYQEPSPPFYAALQQYLDDSYITSFTPEIIRNAVIEIRSEKLPDPKEKPNSGSFFKNAIVEGWQLEEIQKDYPEMPFFSMSDGSFKIPSGWLIEQSGVKGMTFNGVRVSDKNALVLINDSAKNYADLSAARREVRQAVYDKFRIELAQEPLEI